MPKYNVTITSEHVEYSTYTLTIDAKDLTTAKAKAQKLADDEDGDFADTYVDCCDPGDAYETFTVQSVKQVN